MMEGLTTVRNGEQLAQLRPSLAGDWSRIPPSEDSEAGRLVIEFREVTLEKAEATGVLQATRARIEQLEERSTRSLDPMVRIVASAEVEIAREKEKEQARVFIRVSDTWHELTVKLATAVGRHDDIVRALSLDYEVRGDAGSSLTTPRIRELVAESLSLVGPRLECDDRPPPKPAPYVDPGLVALGRSLGHYGPARVR